MKCRKKKATESLQIMNSFSFSYYSKIRLLIIRLQTHCPAGSLVTEQIEPQLHLECPSLQRLLELHIVLFVEEIFDLASQRDIVMPERLLQSHRKKMAARNDPFLALLRQRTHLPAPVERPDIGGIYVYSRQFMLAQYPFGMIFQIGRAHV